MNYVLSKCPVCNGRLKIQLLKCPDCGLELKNDFEISPFDTLTAEQQQFLLAFLKNKGNLSSVQSRLGISYPTAKKQLNDLLMALNLTEDETGVFVVDEQETMSEWEIDTKSNKASEIVKAKLIENGGRVRIATLQGGLCDIRAAKDGVSFLSDKLPIEPPFRYEVFDIIVDTLLRQDGTARKGNGRKYRLGDPDCDESTIVGAIGYQYFKSQTGKAVYDPVFILAAILEWAGIVKNCRGYVELTSEYRERIGFNGTNIGR